MSNIPLPPYGSILRTDFTSFIAKTFQTVDPSTSYLPNWHIDLIAEYLEAARRRDITRLIINIPPRYLKSICANVAWPAWLLGHNPAERIITASYSQSLSLKHALDCRLVIKSEWYKQLFPELSISTDQNEKSKFITTKRGFRFATSVGGTITGEGGNILIVDDPHNPVHMESEQMRKHTLDWFDQTFSTRLNDKKKGVIVLVMQRLHPYDLTHHLLKNKGWEQLILPVITPKHITYRIGNNHTARRKGKILHPEREGKKELERIKHTLGTHAFAAQYLQHPIPVTNNLIQPSWLKRYATPPTHRIIQSWDTAIKSGTQHDYSVCTTWSWEQNGFYLVDSFRKRMEYPELKRYCLNLAKKWQPEAILIEDKASGQSLLQEMKQNTSLPVIPIQAHQAKMERFMKVLPLFEAGRIYLPEQATWLSDFEMELFHFPKGSHDDQIDSMSQFLQWTKKKMQETMQIRMI